jgi:GntR family transcriptional repressor for pyruvate dehydrogenase complex
VATSAAESTTRALYTLIVEGGYRVGDRLPPERDLSETLGLSRPTVREAIGRLVAEGVLQARRGSGTYVAPVDLEHIFTVRLALEPLAAALAAQHRSDQQLAELRAHLDAMRSAIDDARAFAGRDGRAHELLARASGNPVLHDVLERLAGLARLSRSVTSEDAAVRMRTLEHMSGLVAAVEAHDPGRAEAAMRDHLVAVRESVGGAA